MLTAADARYIIENWTRSMGNIESGVDANFYPFDDVGIKLFEHVEERNYSYKLQKVASFKGFGPKCWGRFEVPVYSNWLQEYETKYGYITERVEELLEERLGMDVPGSDWVAHLYHGNHPLHSFWQAMDAAGIRVFDSHHRNYGYLRGKLMLIDYGSPGRHVSYTSHRRTLEVDEDNYESIEETRYKYHKVIPKKPL